MGSFSGDLNSHCREGCDESLSKTPIWIHDDIGGLSWAPFSSDNMTVKDETKLTALDIGGQGQRALDKEEIPCYLHVPLYNALLVWVR